MSEILFIWMCGGYLVAGPWIASAWRAEPTMLNIFLWIAAWPVMMIITKKRDQY